MTEPTRDWYLRAVRELAATSELQSAWCAGVADDDRMLALLDALPRPARQPSLLFAVAAYLGAPPAPYPEWSGWVLAHAEDVARELPGRRVQTNEPGRCAPLLVALARIPGPIALLELGASAGLCLVPERYAYRFMRGDRPLGLGFGAPVLDVEVDDAGLLPGRLPDIRWRRGLDLHPLSVGDADDVRWLEASLPPDRPDRLARLRAAVAVAREDPPRVAAGDALDALAGVAAEAPADATLVVASLGTAVYLAPDARGRLLGEIARLGARSVTFETRAALADVTERWEALVADGRADAGARFLLAVDGEPIASGTAHGALLRAVRPAGRAGAAEPRS